MQLIWCMKYSILLAKSTCATIHIGAVSADHRWMNAMRAGAASIQADMALSGSGLARLRKNLRGELVMPDAPDYEHARRAWNGMIDKRPQAIVYCAEPQDVVHALEFARSEAAPLAVRSGGHNVAGLCVCDGVVIDLSHMKGIAVDPERRIVRAEAGVNLGEFDVATQAHRLATTMGVNSDTGIAGLTLGGGFGKLGRRYGLTCDNLLSAEMVTADGRIVRASFEENVDLFWGLRGGGGNFGIVTAFTYRVHPVGPKLLAGSVVYPYDQARSAMRFYAEFSRNAPDALSLDAALAMMPSGEKVFSVSVCYDGPIAEGEQVIRPLREFGSPVADRIAAVPYLQIQSAGDAVFPRGRRYYWKAQFMRELTDAAIDALIEVYAAAPSLDALLVLQQVGGAISRVPKHATAYVHRDALYDCFPVAIWDNPEDDDAHVRWARDVWQAMRAFSTGGVYANNLGDEGADRVESAYGENYPKLVQLKDKYDPFNLFRLNQNIRPTEQSSPQP
jgi:FAD/FMN-containing dehydrogenase